jgi:hypothetical protein
VGRDDRDEEPKGFLEEVFDHRQVRPDAADPPPDAEPTVSIDDSAPPVAPEVIPATAERTEQLTSEPTAVIAADPLPSAVEPEPVEPQPVEPQPVEPEPVAPQLDAMDRALIDEAMKRSGIVWVQAGATPMPRGVWYVWLDGAAYVLTGAGEQPDLGLADARTATVSARSKETRSLMTEWVGAPSAVQPGDADWDPAAAALAKARLNLPDPANAPGRWAADPAIAVYRIVPLGPLLEAPGRYADVRRGAAPVPTPATTAGPPPKVIHRRQTARRPLS